MFRLALACSLSLAFADKSTAFQPGKLWLDTDGNRIKAHSAGLLQVGDTTYWYGAEGYDSGDGANKIINVYSSIDLYNWKNLGVAFRFNCSEIPPGNVSHCYADRPKVLHDVKRNRFVMWMKSTPFVAVASATSPDGPFKFEKRWYPNGEEMGDPTAFQDPVSGKSYYIYSRRHQRQLQVSEMTDDLMDLTGIQASLGPGKEAPAAFYEPVHGKYFIWSSHCSGWKPNAAEVYRAASLTQRNWTDLGNPTRNKTSFSSQSTYIHRYTTKSGKQRFIYVADRFEPYITGEESSRYVWLPIDISDDGLKLSVTWRDSWSLDELEEEDAVQVV